MKNLTFYILVFISANGMGQQTLGAGVAVDSYEIRNRDLTLEGSPYFDEGFKEGIIYIGKTETPSLIRYNAYQETLEVLGNDQKPQAVLKKKSISARFEGRTYLLIDYMEKVVRQKTGYFNPLNEGRVKLYFKPRKKLLQADNPDHGYEDFKMPRYVDDSSYYLQKNDGPAEEILLNQRYLLMHMKDQKKALKAFIAEKNLKVKSETDAIQLINYYNQLVGNFE